MQQPFSCLPATFDAIEATLSPARLARYSPAAKGDKQLALRLYVWNARICEALYLPLQFAEVAARNAISAPVRKRFGDEWFHNPKFSNLLPNRQKQSLTATISKEEVRRKSILNQDHVVAGLPFGFWVSLMTRSYDKQLWINGVKQSFPNAEKIEDRESIYKKLDQMRHFRNSVAHHYAIFDRGTQREAQNAMVIIGMICGETHWLSKEISNLNRVLIIDRNAEIRFPHPYLVDNSAVSSIPSHSSLT